MAKLYEITGDLLALENMLNSLEDENGEPREPTAEEMETMREWFNVSEKQLQEKFDSYCKFIKNLKITADNIESERKSYADELARLSRRAKAAENKARSVQSLLSWCFDVAGIKKYKSDLFSAQFQNSQKKVELQSTADVWSLPREYLKAPELDTTAIKDAIKDGELVQKEGAENYGKVFFKDGTLLKGVVVTTPQIFVIR